MSDKEQIIINEVDVSGCNYIIAYDPPKEQGTWGGAIHKGACKIYSKDCKYNPDCLFKQLARKTQECEELKDYARRQENQRETYYKEFLKKDKALEEIEEFCNLRKLNPAYALVTIKILDIINKAKGEMNG